MYTTNITIIGLAYKDFTYDSLTNAYIYKYRYMKLRMFEILHASKLQELAEQIVKIGNTFNHVYHLPKVHIINISYAVKQNFKGYLYFLLCG